MNTKRTGNLGEKIAENYLKNKGYQVLEKNYSFRVQGNPLKGEIDIVTKKDDIITFIEVKTLRLALARSGQALRPEEKVNFSKQMKLRRMAESWLMGKKIPLNSKWQIDVISIEINKPSFARATAGEEIKISHFENAISYC
jgi:putative endonuclease